MIEISVKTLWQGKVGIREQFVKEALRLKQGLLVRHGKDFMAIPAVRVKEMIDSKSETRFTDYFGIRKPEYLVYYVWRPTVKQGSLV